jgi:hypothetical protein
LRVPSQAAGQADYVSHALLQMGVHERGACANSFICRVVGGRHGAEHGHDHDDDRAALGLDAGVAAELQQCIAARRYVGLRTISNQWITNETPQPNVNGRQRAYLEMPIFADLSSEVAPLITVRS